MVLPSTSGAWCSARPSAEPSAATLSTSTSTWLPTRSSARWLDSSSTSEVSRASRRAMVAGGHLAVEGERLGAVLVRVAEHPDRVQPGLDQEPLELGDVGLALAGEADDDVGTDAGLGGAVADRTRRARGTGRCRRTAASGAAPARWSAGRTGRSTGRRPASRSSPRSARAASPPAADSSAGPARCRGPPPARAASSRAAAGRRGPCRTRWSSRRPGSARGRPARPASAPRRGCPRGAGR